MMVRSSWARDLCLEAEGLSSSFQMRVVSLLERRLLRKADVVYAPSKFLVDHYANRYGISVQCLRPPFIMDSTIAADLPFALPKRFVFHFGNLGLVKGTDVLAASLPDIWKEEPDFHLVMAGKEVQPNMREIFNKLWGEKSSQVTWLGRIEKKYVFNIIKKSEVVVLPSRYDNLPNTAIESLALGVPVIGTYGSSLDELIEPGHSGELVPKDDSQALSLCLLKVWRQEVDWLGDGFTTPKILHEMTPESAVHNFIRLAGY
jgi:glycosyltransferase involved in cell wall biosynthesis